MRTGLAVVAGAVFWAVLWIGTNQGMMAAFPDLVQPEVPLNHTGVLLSYIVISSILSVGAGYIAATVDRLSPMKAVWILALLQLALGIFFEVSYWTLMPVWYHLVFLALIVPTTVYGGRLKDGRAVA